MAGLCCTALAAVLGSETFSQGSTAYTSSLSSYWSLQETELLPSCIVQPTTAEHVSLAVKTLASNNCSFAVRSGGHSPNAGAANIAAGVTIDLTHLDTVTVSSDQSTVSVGPAATWGAVYSTLDPLNLTVAGGRSGGVGVGGLTLGGGISFHSPRVGFTADTVTNFQVVLADGRIVDSKDDTDLDWSLRGGSNNFGIVTRVDLASIQQGLIWGGNRYSLIDTIDAQLQAFADISNPTTYDEYASLIMTLAYDSASGMQLVVNAIEYTKPEANPPVYQPLMDIPAIASTMRIDSMASISNELAQSSPNGERVFYMTVTHGNSLKMLKAVHEAWSTSVTSIKGVAGVTWSLSLEPLPPAIYERHQYENALGITGRGGKGLVVTLLTALWTNAADDATVETAGETLFEDIKSAAQGLDEYDPYLYLNYANTGSWQGSPIDSYGFGSAARLRQTSAKVDPSGVFQKKVPGGFKLN
ncbi:hypothetical protein N8I77_012311 [Diaporthe amygdali]|uniref:FAD-binding PCMH-type domain-containing protein n=1 Tax=Phomopsis amygdali TaxID=1214568 RepID=A0AAD9S2E7_PHOAM|nr:hypothetical protein N8I77_012311 [Diaporthe amygdali]